VPRNRPAVVVMEGLTPYLPAEEGPRLLSRLVSHLAGGELMFDAYSRFGLKMLRLNPTIRATGAEVHWAIDDPHELERAIPKLRFVDDISAYSAERTAHMGWSAKLFIGLWRNIPALRKVGRILRYRF
jgi:O-methyltransferase involved in polyketide biosynthesis